MTQPLRTAVIGAGMSGLFLGYHLKQAGMPFTIFEKRSAVGGTWHANSYPGLHVDVLTRNYEFPFARAHHWTKRYAPGSEVRSYLADFAVTQDLMPNIWLNTDVTAAEWKNGEWIVAQSDGTTAAFDVLVSATGFLRVPKVPAIPGADSFSGKMFHSSEWDHSIDLDDRSIRYGVVGTGSSGVQITSELGELGLDVTQFIRHPQWMQVKPNPEYEAWEKFVLRVPELAEQYDLQQAEERLRTDGNETWRLQPGPDRDEMQQRFFKMLEDEIPDPELRAKLTPREPLGVKRIPKTPNYYRVIQQPNAHPVFGGISEIVPEGVIDSAGDLHELDVLVLATGFDAHAYMRPMQLRGADGIDISEAWKDGVRAFKSLSVPGFPNMFLLCGPFAPVNSISIPRTLRDEVGYLMKLLSRSEESGMAFAPTDEATEGFLERIRQALPQTTYAEGDNWYSQEVGTPIIYPFTRAQHEADYASLDLSSYVTYPTRRGNVTSAGGSLQGE